jgi:hypothetical protein
VRLPDSIPVRTDFLPKDFPARAFSSLSRWSAFGFRERIFFCVATCRVKFSFSLVFSRRRPGQGQLDLLGFSFREFQHMRRCSALEQIPWFPLLILFHATVLPSVLGSALRSISSAEFSSALVHVLASIPCSLLSFWAS